MYLRLKPSFSLISRPLAVSLLFHGGSSKKSLALLYKAFLWLLLSFTTKDSLHLLALPTHLSPSLKKLPHLYYKSFRLISICCFMSELVVFQPSFPCQFWADLRIKLRLFRSSWSLGVHSPAHAFSYFHK